jgi:hypothetical protein
LKQFQETIRNNLVKLGKSSSDNSYKLEVLKDGGSNSETENRVHKNSFLIVA